MANGDIAGAQGFTPVASSKDIRQGYDDINRLADWVATRTIGRRIGASGRADITPTGSGSTYEGQLTVTFPTGRFSSTPRVAATPLTQSSEGVYVGIADITATSFTLYLKRATATATGIHWVALENG